MPEPAYAFGPNADKRVAPNYSQLIRRGRDRFSVYIYCCCMAMVVCLLSFKLLEGILIDRILCYQSEGVRIGRLDNTVALLGSIFENAMII